MNIPLAFFKDSCVIYKPSSPDIYGDSSLIAIEVRGRFYPKEERCFSGEKYKGDRDVLISKGHILFPPTEDLEGCAGSLIDINGKRYKLLNLKTVLEGNKVHHYKGEVL